MAHKFSFIILGGSGKTIKQVHCCRKTLYSCASILFIAALIVGYGVVDYIGAQLNLTHKRNLEINLAQQTEEVLHQREQIQKFATEINALKEKLVQLNQFEQKIRIIANIGQRNETDGLFGVGGSAPEDLNPNMDLSQRHQSLIRDMHQQIDQLDGASLIQRDDFKLVLGKLEQQKNLLAHTPAIRPVRGWITSTFGYRQSPFTGKREFHRGLDIANRKGTPIMATADGVVSFAAQKGLFGNLVVVDHGHGIVSRYGHVDEFVVSAGEVVKRGQQIATMGNTGRSTGPHVHYEVRLNGVPINPSKYILN
jgi:murein DD-endopeptidase MepM/ murein hydrolase activator NlpD